MQDSKIGRELEPKCSSLSEGGQRTSLRAVNNMIRDKM
jgi:hypothetical protein